MLINTYQITVVELISHFDNNEGFEMYSTFSFLLLIQPLSYFAVGNNTVTT